MTYEEISNMHRNWLQNQICGKLGNGKDIPFWQAKWLGSVSFKVLFPQLFEEVSSKMDSVSDMGNWVDSKWRWNCEFNIPESDQRYAFVDELQNVLHGVSPLADSKDKWIWIADPVNGFSVKSCYKELSRSSVSVDPNSSLQVALQWLWKASIPSKVQVFVWRIFLSRLPTCDELLKRGALTAPFCSSCVFCLVS
jgi:hypothetical protein